MNERDELIGAYIDGELDSEAAREVERLIKSDPEARQTAENFREVSALLRAACGEQVYAGGAAQPMIMSGAGIERRRLLRRRLIYATGASVAVAAAFAGGVFVTGGFRSDVDKLVDELAEYHAVFSRETDHLTEIPAARADEIANWLGARLQRRLVIPDLSGAGLQFAGGRMLVVDARPVAALLYTRARGLPVAVCVARLDGGPSAVQVSKEGQQRIAVWQDGTYAYVVVGELDNMTARDIADRAAAKLNA
jgi:anti-sigma factor RsiW